MSEAKAIYPLISIAPNAALVMSGYYMKMLSKTVAAGSLGAMLQIFAASITAVTAVMLASKWWVDNKVAPAGAWL